MGVNVVTRTDFDTVVQGYVGIGGGAVIRLGEHWMMSADARILGRNEHVEEGEEPSLPRETVLELLADRLEGLPRVVLERCVAAGDRVVVYFRASEVEADPTDDRPLQTRRSYTIGRYAGVITIRDGKVVRIQDYPHVHAALDAVGLAGEFS